jgi:hypothetical protein
VHLDAAGQVARGHRLRHLHRLIDRRGDGAGDVAGADDAISAAITADSTIAHSALLTAASILHAICGNLLIQLLDLHQRGLGLLEQRPRLVVQLVEIGEQILLLLLILVAASAAMMAPILSSTAFHSAHSPVNCFHITASSPFAAAAPALPAAVDVGPGLLAQLDRLRELVLRLKSLS